jgi:hypothetical protein
MALGDTTGDSIIWVPGESLGRDSQGHTVDAPEDVIVSGALLILAPTSASETFVTGAIAAVVSDVAEAVELLRSEMVASGYLPA